MSRFRLTACTHSLSKNMSTNFAMKEILRTKELVEAAREIGTALHVAIIKMDAGLMTIVADLSDLGYNALKPAQMDKVVQLLLPKYFSHWQNMWMSSTLTDCCYFC